jgi:hypothetical protein
MIMLDDAKAQPGEVHFVEDPILRNLYAQEGVTYDVLKAKGGCEKAAFQNSLYFVQTRGWPQDDIVVFFEDDYAVAQNWLDLVPEGLQFGNYATLYDHPDKYSSIYPTLLSRLYQGELSHWRSTPSTTNSYFCTVRTLLEDMNTHRAYSEGLGVTPDHEKFIHLWSVGRSLVSCIPGAWSHEEVGMRCAL